MNVHVQDRGRPARGWRDSFSPPPDDFGAAMRAGWRDGRVEALATPPKASARARPVPWAGLESMAPTGSGGRADGARQVPPRRQPRERRGEMQHDAAHRALDPDGELEQPLPQRGDLAVGAGGAARAALKLLEQDVGGPRQQDA